MLTGTTTLLHCGADLAHQLDPGIFFFKNFYIICDPFIP